MSAPRESPGPWHGIPAPPLSFGHFPRAAGETRSTEEGKVCRLARSATQGSCGALRDLGPPTLRHGPRDLAPECRSDEGRRRSNQDAATRRGG